MLTITPMNVNITTAIVVTKKNTSDFSMFSSCILYFLDVYKVTTVQINDLLQYVLQGIRPKEKK